MKKLLFLLAVLVFPVLASAQFVEHISVYNINADTIEIDRTDNIFAITVSCPSWATDSMYVTGTTNTLDGETSGAFTIAPGEHLSFGSGQYPISYMYIVAAEKGRVITFIRQRR